LNASAFCSGEFGNPSGHALLASQVALTYLLYYKDEAASWFKKNPIQGALVHVLVFVYIAGVCICRIYLGRHSLDQIILGLAIGIVVSVFMQKCFKPYLFEPVFYPKRGENMNVSVTRARKAFIISAVFYAVVLVKMIGLYLYVDRNNVIPQQWLDSVIQTCPVYKLSNLFHHFSITHTGLVILIPSYFLWNWLVLRQRQKEGKTPIEGSEITGWLEASVRILGFVVLDYLLTDAGPKLIFGTKNFNPFPGDMIRKQVMVVGITWFLFFGSPRIVAFFSDNKQKTG